MLDLPSVGRLDIIRWRHSERFERVIFSGAKDIKNTPVRIFRVQSTRPLLDCHMSSSGLRDTPVISCFYFKGFVWLVSVSSSKTVELQEHLLHGFLTCFNVTAILAVTLISKVIKL